MSGVGIEVYPERLPIGEGVRGVAEILRLDPLELALASGEEFELVFTVPPELVDAIDFEFSIIGRVVEEKGVYLVSSGDKKLLPRLGWEHFTDPKV